MTKQMKGIEDDMAAHQHDVAIQFTKGKHRFEIFQTNSHGGPRYEGYFDGRLSVSAHEKHVAARMLLRRHTSRHMLTLPPTLPL
jgi:hypothetical protein